MKDPAWDEPKELAEEHTLYAEASAAIDHWVDTAYIRSCLLLTRSSIATFGSENTAIVHKLMNFSFSL